MRDLRKVRYTQVRCGIMELVLMTISYGLIYFILSERESMLLHICITQEQWRKISKLKRMSRVCYADTWVATIV